MKYMLQKRIMENENLSAVTFKIKEKRNKKKKASALQHRFEVHYILLGQEVYPIELCCFVMPNQNPVSQDFRLVCP